MRIDRQHATDGEVARRGRVRKGVAPAAPAPPGCCSRNVSSCSMVAPAPTWTRVRLAVRGRQQLHARETLGQVDQQHPLVRAATVVEGERRPAVHDAPRRAPIAVVLGPVADGHDVVHGERRAGEHAGRGRSADPSCGRAAGSAAPARETREGPGGRWADRAPPRSPSSSRWCRSRCSAPSGRSS